jgi:hypothetical protein
MTLLHTYLALSLTCPDIYADSVQAILRFQRLTREAMYRRIAGALQAAGSSEKPTDYLVFFCLGNRESGPKEPPQPANGNNSTPKMDAPGVPSGVHRRHMVYVHSKFMVVDDEIAIIGALLLTYTHTAQQCFAAHTCHASRDGTLAV